MADEKPATPVQPAPFAFRARGNVCAVAGDGKPHVAEDSPLPLLQFGVPNSGYKLNGSICQVCGCLFFVDK